MVMSPHGWGVQEAPRPQGRNLIVSVFQLYNLQLALCIHGSSIIRASCLLLSDPWFCIPRFDQL